MTSYCLICFCPLLISSQQSSSSSSSSSNSNSNSVNLSHLPSTSFQCSYLSVICKICFEEYLRHEIKNGRISNDGSIRCFCNSHCPSKINNNQIIEYLQQQELFDSIELLEKYQKFYYRLQVVSNPNITFCIFPECEGIANIEKNKQATCQICQNTFCSKCHSQHSAFSSCQSAEDIVRFTHSNNGNCKKCPNCRQFIEKNGGCYHMQCSFCSYHFCWSCKRDISSCRRGLLCSFGAFQKDYRWGDNTSKRFISKSILYPILSVVGVGVCVSAVGVGIGVVAIGSVTVAPFYGGKYLYSHWKSANNSSSVDNNINSNNDNNNQINNMNNNIQQQAEQQQEVLITETSTRAPLDRPPPFPLQRSPRIRLSQLLNELQIEESSESDEKKRESSTDNIQEVVEVEVEKNFENDFTFEKYLSSRQTLQNSTQIEVDLFIRYENMYQMSLEDLRK